MANPPCWREISDQERAVCIGEPRHLACCSQHAWDVAGDLQTDWNSRVQPQIVDLVAKNYKRVFGKKGAHALLSFHLYWLSATKDPATATPTILILTVDKKAATNAKKLLLKHDIFKGLNTGFDIAFEDKPILLRMGRAHSDHLALRQDAESRNLSGSSLCGVSTVTRPYPPSLDSGWRRATIFCAVAIGDHHFVVLPAHTFYPESDNTKLKDDEDDQSDLSSSQSASECSSKSWNEDSDNCPSRSGSSNSFEAGQDMSSSPAQNAASHHLVYLDRGRSAFDSGYNDMTFLGTINLGESHATICRPLDYALVPIVPSLTQGIRTIDLVGNAAPLAEYTLQPRSGLVLLTSGHSQPKEVHMSGTTVTLAGPWSKRPQVVWQIDYVLESGDSGSLVTSDDGKVIGMAFAAAPDLNVSYIMPARDIFDDIWTNRARITALLIASEATGSLSLLTSPRRYSSIRNDPEDLGGLTPGAAVYADADRSNVEKSLTQLSETNDRRAMRLSRRSESAESERARAKLELLELASRPSGLPSTFRGPRVTKHAANKNTQKGQVDTVLEGPTLVEIPRANRRLGRTGWGREELSPRRSKLPESRPLEKMDRTVALSHTAAQDAAERNASIQRRLQDVQRQLVTAEQRELRSVEREGKLRSEIAETREALSETRRRTRRLEHLSDSSDSEANDPTRLHLTPEDDSFASSI